jgi:hypothetical protein
MHAAIRAFLTDEHITPEHSRTYAALERLIPGNSNPADLLLAVEFHDETLAQAAERGANLVITPIAREGFVFILHKDNPVDSLTQQQIRDIYTGRITNWNQVGGLDEEIQPFTRNWDSGSQTAMENFMQGEQFSGFGDDDAVMMQTMGRLLFGVQQAGSAGIGYNIFSWSMLQNLDEMGLKTVAVDGIKPTNQALSDGSYPLMVYTYSYFNYGNEKAQILTEWLLTEQGQKVIASAGYVGINGQLPPDITPDFEKDEFYSNRAVIEYYHGLGSSRIERARIGRIGRARVYDAYVRFEDGSYHRFVLSTRIVDRELTYAFAESRGKDVTVLRLVHFVPTSDSENFRFIVLTRERSGEFEVINEGVATDEMIAMFRGQWDVSEQAERDRYNGRGDE